MTNRHLASALAASALAGSLVACVFIAFPSQAFSWDVLERSHVLWTWERALPGSRYFWAHILELPLARPFHVAFATVSHPSEGMQVLESVSAGLIVALVAFIAAGRSGSLVAGVALALPVAVSSGFWDLASHGEEKVVGALFLLGAATAYLRVTRNESATASGAVLTGLLWAVAPLVHLTNLILFPYLMVDAAYQAITRRRLGGGSLRSTVVVGVVAAGTLVPSLFAYVRLTDPTAPPTLQAITRLLLTYHGGNIADVLAPAQPTPWFQLPIGLQATVATSSSWGLSIFVTAFSLAVGLAVRALWHIQNERRPALAFVTLSGGWILHFWHYEPWNPESWLALWTGTVLFIGWSVGGLLAGPGRRALGPVSAVAVALSVTLLVGNLSWFRSQHGPFESGVIARAFDEKVEPGYILLAGTPLAGRVYRLYCLHRAYAMALLTVLNGMPEGCCTDEFLSAAAVNQKLAGGVPVYADADAARDLGRAGVELHQEVDLAPRGKFFRVRSKLPESR
jgi:hypothetical protein